MATTVALPPFSTLQADVNMPRFTDSEADPLPSILCGFESRLSCVKSEPVLEECMESFCNSTYTELTSATFSQLKLGQPDLYVNSVDGQSFNSWTFIHPEHWEAREVLDWLFSLAEAEHFDGANFRGEAYNTLSGKKLCSMTATEFIALDPHYGARVYEVFQSLLSDANFKKPSSPDTVQYETLSGNVPDFACLECSSDVSPAHTPPHLNTSQLDGRHLSIFLDSSSNDMKVSLDGLGTYDIDITLTGCQAFDHIDDSDYSSGSDADMDRSNSVSSEPMFSDDEDSNDIVIPDVTGSTHTHTHSTSSDSGNESDDRRTSSRRRTASSSKGNHLWEFVRDLLKDTRFNPSLVKWEDRDQGVFRFVQSEAVAEMWGRKKNNPGMTYEKLSRAMRFCRSAGYFDIVPRTGRFPKKLCFKFGPRAHSWQD